jgi:hypothetical protein
MEIGKMEIRDIYLKGFFGKKIEQNLADIINNLADIIKSSRNVTFMNYVAIQA